MYMYTYIHTHRQPTRKPPKRLDAKARKATKVIYIYIYTYCILCVYIYIYT